MITSITFFVSLLGIIFLFWNKKRELEQGKAFVAISHVNEHFFKTKMKDVGQSAKEMPKKVANVVAFLAVKQGVRTFEKVKEVVYPKISHIVDAVKGRDIPKNRGSVSLFLKHIENFRETK
jgi:hypothetical protein